MAERGTPPKFRPVVAAGRDIPNRPTIRPIKPDPVTLSAPQQRRSSRNPPPGASAQVNLPAHSKAKSADGKATTGAFAMRSTLSGVGTPAPGSHAPPLPVRRNGQNESFRPLVRNTAAETDVALEYCSSLAATAVPAYVASELDDIDLDALFASFEEAKPVSPASPVSPANTTKAKPAPLVPLAPPLASLAPAAAPAASATTKPAQPGAAAHSDADAPSKIHHDQIAETQLAPSMPVSKPSRLRWFAVGAAFGMAVVIGTMRLAVIGHGGGHDVAIAAARFAVGHGWNATPSPEPPSPLPTPGEPGEPTKPAEAATPSVAMSSEAPARATAAPVATDEALMTSESVEPSEPASHPEPEPAKPSVETPAAVAPERPERQERVVKKQVAPAPTTPKVTPPTPPTPRANVAVRNAPPATPADKPKPQKPPANSGEGRAASAPKSDPADIFGAALRP